MTGCILSKQELLPLSFGGCATSLPDFFFAIGSIVN